VSWYQSEMAHEPLLAAYPSGPRRNCTVTPHDPGRRVAQRLETKTTPGRDQGGQSHAPSLSDAASVSGTAAMLGRTRREE
jgi:hypothetical protein